MDGLLLEEIPQEADVGGYIELLRELRLEVVQLRNEVASLRRENLELRQQVGYWKCMHARAVGRIAVLERENEQLQGENRRLQQQLFGQKSEKQSRKDRSNDLEDPQETATKPQRHRGQQPDRPAPQRRDYAHLPERIQKVELPPEHWYCPDCGKRLKLRTDTEDATQIEIEVILYRRVWQRCR